MAAPMSSCLMPGLAGVTLQANTVHTDAVATFVDLDGAEQSILVTTGGRLVYVDSDGNEHGGVVLWPETNDKIVKPAPAPAMIEEAEGDGLSAMGTAPAVQPSLTLMR